MVEKTGIVFHGNLYQSYGCNGAWMWEVLDEEGTIWAKGLDYDYKFAKEERNIKTKLWNEHFSGLDPHVLYYGLMDYKGPKGFGEHLEREENKDNVG